LAFPLFHFTHIKRPETFNVAAVICVLVDVEEPEHFLSYKVSEAVVNFKEEAFVEAKAVMILVPGDVIVVYRLVVILLDPDVGGSPSTPLS
jgi:hypothetical protein